MAKALPQSFASSREDLRGELKVYSTLPPCLTHSSTRGSQRRIEGALETGAEGLEDGFPGGS